MYNYGPSCFAEVTNCHFMNNSAKYGSGMYNDYSNPTLIACYFLENYYLGTGYSYVARYETRSSPMLIECTFEGNFASYGGSINNNYDCEPSAYSCLFIDNTAGTSGGGIWNDFNCSTHLSSCLFCQNTPDDIYGDWSDEGGNEFLDECPTNCEGDVNGDGDVNVTDLLAIIGNWGRSIRRERPAHRHRQLGALPLTQVTHLLTNPALRLFEGLFPWTVCYRAP